MAVNTSRILIKTFVKSALKDADEAPERCTRKLVDMALNFAHGRFQQEFFEMAQTMLSNENSPYYPLIEDILKHMDKERLLDFGMNLGYNGCTMGAHIIRKYKRKENLDIPWMLPIETGDLEAPGILEQYNSIIQQGKELGIYIYMFLPDQSPEKLLELARKNSDCAVLILCRADQINEDLANAAEDLTNLMIGIKYDENADAACLLLRDHRLIYSLYFKCTENDVTSVVNGVFYRFAEEMHSPFSAIMPTIDCPEDIRQQIYQSVLHTRNEQLYRTIPLDLCGDTRRVGNIISPPDCTVGFDRSGQMCTLEGTETNEEFNFFRSSLKDILEKKPEIKLAQ